MVSFRRNTIPAVQSKSMPTVTADQIPGLLTAAGVIQQNQGINHRFHPVDSPLRTLVGAGNHVSLLFSGWYKQNSSQCDETSLYSMIDPFGTFTARDTTTLLMAECRAVLSELALQDCYFRMMGPREVGRGCGFDLDFLGHSRAFVVWGSARGQVDGFGNAVSPQVGEWIGARLRAVLHGEAVARSAQSRSHAQVVDRRSSPPSVARHDRTSIYYFGGKSTLARPDRRAAARARP